MTRFSQSQLSSATSLLFHFCKEFAWSLATCLLEQQDGLKLTTMTFCVEMYCLCLDELKDAACSHNFAYSHCRYKYALRNKVNSRDNNALEPRKIRLLGHFLKLKCKLQLLLTWDEAFLRDAWSQVKLLWKRRRTVPFTDVFRVELRWFSVISCRFRFTDLQGLFLTWRPTERTIYLDWVMRESLGHWENQILTTRTSVTGTRKLQWGHSL